ncbi:alpha/beta hydrolase [Sphingomonas canadensis]|uniref:Alpha/beta hydrolase n=1 Tax=Sphingomonas canadensis TaxID=1219257 RepID=A0ABW3H4J0_9SPHN|nr:lysophospholipase [Sphingomonas canadensis]MCW3835481.1 lysophospholipase [Sphingomonas canadensis]
MWRPGVALVAALALAACGGTAPRKAPEAPQQRSPVQLIAADGVRVYGDYLKPQGAKALIVLLHQAGSGQGEYATIAPRLAARGFATLAIDQRAGGDMFGGNFTVKSLGREGSYLDARKDIDAALEWAKSEHLPVILWGSSYSASLALLVAADNPRDVTAVLAFSPAEYFDGNPSVRDAAAKVKVPVFVTSSADAKEVASAKALVEAVPGQAKRQFVPVKGAHGSSILIAERDPEGAEAAWDAVFDFLLGLQR